MADLASKISIVLLIVTLGVAIASLVLNAIILSKENNKSSVPSSTHSPSTTPGQCSQGTPLVGHSAKYQEAANTLYAALDLSVDPCDDFYAFTCNSYLATAKIPENAGRIGTYDQAQQIVNLRIYDALANITDSSTKTERITKKAIDACVVNAQLQYHENKTQAVYGFVTALFGGLPIIDPSWKSIDAAAFWKGVGTLEGVHNVGSFFQAQVTVNEQDVEYNALYINQGGLMMPRDFYVKPQFLSKVEDYLSSVNETLTAFAQSLSLSEPAAEDLEELVQFEIQLATAMVPDDLLRNYRQQFNGYSLAELLAAYPSVDWAAYFAGMPLPDSVKDGLTVAQPTYVAALNSLFGSKGGVYDGKRFSMKTAVNFVVLRLLQDSSNFLGGEQHERFVAFLADNGVKKPVTPSRDSIVGCVNDVAELMVYGPGYVYIESIPERVQVQQNVSAQTTLVIDSFLEMMGTLTWMSDDAKNAAKDKAAHLVKNIGWPEMFDWKNGTLDAYNAHYEKILKEGVTDYWDILQILKQAYQLTENLGTVNAKADRSNFLSSPSTVNAWYQPERNSITFPYAAFNPPYFDFEYPQAYNFAGQGGTGGHELTHGFDDEGVQFGPNGTLGGCSWDYCGWMDASSRAGFQTMAQCVISQYSSTCCPVKEGAVHCANGATTQGENIADLGGQQAAYNAYQKWKQQYNGGHEEARLPAPMDKYTPNQIFWITYGHSWCMKQETKNLVNQLLTNPHAPGSCRTNQVVQDIPAFGRDFNCPRGSKMYPKPEENVRCKVWTGV
ncbi:hypothetical protein QR680_017151 [Steinernema hermaphroditum]|uniref:Peptidase M13 C-terminal domain-containing protein n=1 Tax=Steinernema hermaphroditum TaxID=289476 RepID=A0AA39HDH0_9BILA|nr:hypothetical protein QR680_017151 [Steinernema hermaphroditum]